MDKQREVVKYLIQNGESKKVDIYNAMQFGYFCNWEKHFGDLLRRMIKNGSIQKVKRGVYKVNDTYKDLINQTKLF